LDFDRRWDAPRPVENIVWTKKAPKGKYKVSVVTFSSNHRSSMPFDVGIVKDGGEMKMFKKTATAKGGSSVAVTTFAYP